MGTGRKSRLKVVAGKAIYTTAIIALVLAMLPGCAFKAKKTTERVDGTAGRIDYSAKGNWLSKPDETNLPVDVFYLYPTSWAGEEGEEGDFCQIDDSRMLAGAKAHFASEATAFETVGNIYAPYYRQMEARLALSLSAGERDELLRGAPMEDALSAFDYYMENLNKGRPFILAGDSQGSNVLMLILSDYMKENPKVYERMVAAYLIGYSVTEDYLKANPHLNFAEGRRDTGVIVSFNTEAPEIEGVNPVLLAGAMAINPISWTRTDEAADASKSLGSRMTRGDEFIDIAHFADARVDTDRGSVICSTIDPEENRIPYPIFGKGAYHTLDYSLYYYDIRENARARANSFLDD